MLDDENPFLTKDSRREEHKISDEDEDEEYRRNSFFYRVNDAIRQSEDEGLRRKWIDLLNRMYAECDMAIDVIKSREHGNQSDIFLATSDPMHIENPNFDVMFFEANIIPYKVRFKKRLIYSFLTYFNDNDYTIHQFIDVFRDTPNDEIIESFRAFIYNYYSKRDFHDNSQIYAHRRLQGVNIIGDEITQEQIAPAQQHPFGPPNIIPNGGKNKRKRSRKNKRKRSRKNKRKRSRKK